MKILLIDTCGATGSVALADTDLSPTLIASASLPGRSAAERLLPAIRRLAATGATGVQSGTGLQSLDAVAVVHGPGSFTGVRVGLSAAKGLCHALNRPLVAISRLAVLASLAQSLGQPAPSDAAPVQALIDAGRGEFYSGLYRDGVCLCEALLTRDELLAAHRPAIESPAAEPTFATGAASVHHPPLQPAEGLAEPRRQPQRFAASSLARRVVACEPTVAESLAALSPQIVAEPAAQDALPLVLSRIRQRAFDDPATLDANYLRRSDAEIFARPIAAAAPQPHAAQPETSLR